MRPRVLYFAIFTYLSLSGGRFTATFLEHELRMNQNWMIGSAMAIQKIASSLFSSWFGSLADSWEAECRVKNMDIRWNRGRLLVVTLGLGLSTVATLMHSLGSLWLSSYHVNGNEDSQQTSVPMLILAYHFFLRALYATGVAASVPVLDGMTLAQLERDGRGTAEYGKERVYGAISWGIANVFFGPAIDKWGFKTLYYTTILSFIWCFVTFYLYAKSNQTPSSEVVIDDAMRNNNTVGLDGAIEYLEESMRLLHVSQKSCNRNDQPTQQKLGLRMILHMISQQQTPVLNLSYIAALFMLWIGMSVVENLIFLFFEFLGGSNVLCGLTVAVTVLFELPIFHYAPNILAWMGSPKTMFQWGCVAYVVRVLGYSIVPERHAYWVLLFEPLHGVTIGFVSTASVSFVNDLMPRGYESSGQGFISTVSGFGQFVGLLIGGFIEGRTLYRVMAVIVSVGSAVLAVGSYATTKPSTDKRLYQVIS
eukprot:g13493.t1 g13493   contig8:808080-809513(+)